LLDDYEIWVAFDSDGRAARCYLMKASRPASTFFDRVRDWLGL
jgi:hypothetical protein